MTSRLSSHFSVFGLVFFWELRDNFYSLMSGLQALGKIFLPNFHRSFRIKYLRRNLGRNLQPKIAKLARRTKKAKGMTLEFRKATKALENWGVRASIQSKALM